MWVDSRIRHFFRQKLFLSTSKESLLLLNKLKNRISVKQVGAHKFLLKYQLFLSDFPPTSLWCCIQTSEREKRQASSLLLLPVVTHPPLSRMSCVRVLPLPPTHSYMHTHVDNRRHTLRPFPTNQPEVWFPQSASEQLWEPKWTACQKPNETQIRHLCYNCGCYDHLHKEYLHYGTARAGLQLKWAFEVSVLGKQPLKLADMLIRVQSLQE